MDALRTLVCIKDDTLLRKVIDAIPAAEAVGCQEMLAATDCIIIHDLSGCSNAESHVQLLRENHPLFITDSSRNPLLLECIGKAFFLYITNDSVDTDLASQFALLSEHATMAQRLKKLEQELTTIQLDFADNAIAMLAKQEDLEDRAVRDGLTHLFNHSYFKERLNDEFDRARRYSNTFSLAVFDMDDFKNVNDTHGHLKGDEVLQRFAKSIRETVRKSDIAARYGGEEFTVIFTETPLKSAELAIKRLRENFRKEVFTSESGETFTVNFSAGLTHFGKKYSEPSEMIEIADQALYISKAAGKNRTTIM